LRVTLVVLGPGGEIPEHQAEGPVTVLLLSGRIRFSAADQEHDLAPGHLLSAGPGVRHRVTSDQGGVFLLTVRQAER
jgi:quercetin dioxygenase-like cupin family protein